MFILLNDKMMAEFGNYQRISVPMDISAKCR